MRIRQAAAGLALLAVSISSCNPQDPAPFRGTIHNPYSGAGGWYRGNFHMHSLHSDGAQGAPQLVASYVSGDAYGGYQVLSITDHDGYGDQDGGVLDGRDTYRYGEQNQFVLPRFQLDDDVLFDWNGDGRTFPQFERGSGVEAYVRDYDVERPAWMTDRWTRGDGTIPSPPVIIPGFEGSYGGLFSAHFVLLGFPSGPLVSSSGDHFDRGRLEQDIENLRGANPLGFTFVAHPRANDQAGLFSVAAPVDRLDGIEIANGLRLSEGAWIRDPDPFATPLWDALLSSGHRLWGLANDDAHTFQEGCDAPPFTAWNMIRTSDLTRDGILRALRSGSFYASTGLFFDELGVRDGAIVAAVPGATLLRFIGRNGVELAVARAGTGTGASAPLHLEYPVSGAEGYVRIEAFGELVAEPEACRNQNDGGRDTWGTWPRAAWSQPFFLEALEDAPAGSRGQ